MFDRAPIFWGTFPLWEYRFGVLICILEYFSFMKAEQTLIMTYLTGLRMQGSKDYWLPYRPRRGCGWWAPGWWRKCSNEDHGRGSVAEAHKSDLEDNRNQVSPKQLVKNIRTYCTSRWGIGSRACPGTRLLIRDTWTQGGLTLPSRSSRHPEP